MTAEPKYVPPLAPVNSVSLQRSKRAPDADAVEDHRVRSVLSLLRSRKSITEQQYRTGASLSECYQATDHYLGITSEFKERVDTSAGHGDRAARNVMMRSKVDEAMAIVGPLRNVIEWLVLEEAMGELGRAPTLVEVGRKISGRKDPKEARVAALTTLRIALDALSDVRWPVVPLD